MSPDSDRGRATVRRIIEAACDLFYRQGVRATGLNQIAEVSGTGKGQLYHFFADKNAIIAAVIAEQVNQIVELQEQYVAQMTSLSDLYAWVELLVGQHEQPDSRVRCPLGALVIELAGENPAFRVALDEGFGRWRDALANGLKNLIASGELPQSRDPQLMAELLLTAYEGGVLMSQVHGNTSSLRLALHTGITAILTDIPVTEQES